MIDEAFLAERERIRAAASALKCGDEDFIVDAVNSQPALIAEIRRLRAWQRAVVALPGDCWEHADNCCDEWCQGCVAGTRAESDRERLFDEVVPQGGNQ